MAKNTSSAIVPKERLVSLDILRGLDLFLLLWFQPVLLAVASAAGWPWLDDIVYHFDHEVWVGFRLWDLVMPLFLFMVGAAMPFSFAKYRSSDNSRPSHTVYTRIVRRFLLLFLFGMIVQGNLLGLDPSHIYIYTNTLQAIAFGYLIAALILLHCHLRMQILWTIILMAVYWIPMALFGDYSPTGSFAFRVDELIIGRFRGDLTYTWVWSSLTFGATVMLGALAGELMRADARDKSTRTALRLAVIGAALVIAALILSCAQPIIKRIWTVTMTLLSGGFCYILMALFYWWVDCRGHSRGLGWLKIYGMNPITAYVLGEVINFRSIVASVSYGLKPLIGPWYDAWLTFGNFAILFLILAIMHRNKLYLKL